MTWKRRLNDIVGCFIEIISNGSAGGGRITEINSNLIDLNTSLLENDVYMTWSVVVSEIESNRNEIHSNLIDLRELITRKRHYRLSLWEMIWNGGGGDGRITEINSNLIDLNTSLLENDVYMTWSVVVSEIESNRNEIHSNLIDLRELITRKRHYRLSYEKWYEMEAVETVV